jgi:CxxC motif-containing protein (DUF1111 family)
MPRFGLVPAASRLPRSRSSTAPAGGAKLYALALIALGLGFLALTTAPLLDVGAQSATSFRPHDPGVRGGNAGAGGPIAGLTQSQLNFFGEGLARFNEVDSVTGSISGEDGKGLGPRFNMNSCVGCHAQPAAGGSSPTLGVGVNQPNPQVAVANLHGATNQIPSFITSDGPVREVRFIKNPDGSADGGVHDLFTIAGRSDAPGCTTSVLQQPNFAANLANGNVSFRIPTPTFGAGLIAAISEETLVDNVNANATAKSSLGISGKLNREGNTGTITRFGWKGQNKSAVIFSGEAYLVEQGVSNEVFTQERGEPWLDGGMSSRVEPDAACLYMGTPEDATDLSKPNALQGMSDVQGFAFFMTLTAPPSPAPLSSSAANGKQLFNQVGCALCHTPQMTTGRSNIAALGNQPVNLYSDLAVHNMGSGLADHVSQGAANDNEFRTAPLWGVGQRVFFLHDGRTKDLYQAILAHSSTGSEANAVINRFVNLGAGQQDVLNFLRSL